MTNVKAIKKPKQVKLIDGTLANITDCKKISNIYYLKTECVEIDDKWYPKDLPHIKFDSNIQKWVVDLRGRLYTGIIGFDGEEPVFGFFSPNIYTNCLVSLSNGTKHRCIDYRILNSLYYIECFNIPNMEFVHKTIRSSSGSPQKFSFDKQGYNIEECSDFDSKKESYSKFSLNIDKTTIRAAKLLGDITFGCECETEKGLLPTNIQNQLGIVICKDGSIDYSAEYVTVPYSGAKGLQALKLMFDEVDKRCVTSHRCSLHYHFGNVRTDRQYIISIYKLFYEIQEELFLMLPYYKRFYKGYKKQDYNKPLTNLIPMYDRNSEEDYRTYINNTYKKLFKFLNSDVPPSPDSNRKNHAHSAGPTKWMIKDRYMALNFIPMLFSKRETLEFRMAQGTVNRTKAINWFFICLAIIKFVNIHGARLLTDHTFTYSLKDVIYIYPQNSNFLISDYLWEYYLNRVEFHQKCIDNQDFLSDLEYIKEKDFTFTAFGITHLY